jgi:uncharacterized protein (TIGR00255 family)
MIKGMTGFGSTTFMIERIRAMMELKSQNHRYFDLVCYLPVGFGSIEEKMRSILSKELHRGRIVLSLKIVDKAAPQISFQKEVAREYLKYAKAMKKDFGLTGSFQLSDLIRLPGVVETKETVVDGENVWPQIERALNKTLKSLMGMRKREGKALCVDTSSVLKQMCQQINLIKTRTKDILHKKREVLTHEEFTSFQKSQDINEEMTRLIHYIDEFRLLLRTMVSVGKKLDFIGQEMQRETNTIGSKIQDHVVSSAVIALKSKIEKLREQAQNIE